MDATMWLALFIGQLAAHLSGINAEGNYTYQVKTIDVPIDHFSFTSDATFKLRYLINDTFARSDGSPDSPILFYAGNEGNIELFAQNTGFMWELAPKFKATLVFAEHRYYGHSLPFGNASYESPKNLGYLTSEQALADYAVLLRALNAGNATTRARPVIAFGGSYGGMLAAWFRIKYPHLVAGAIAASAPVRQFQDVTPCGIFNQILTSVFQSAYTPECTANIRHSWTVLQNYSTTADGLKVLNEKFHFCTNLTKAADVTDTFFDYLTDVYGNLAMINYPYESNFLAPVPAYPVREFCGRLAQNYTGTELLDHLQSALSIYANYDGKTPCLNINSSYDGSGIGDRGWDFQACTEMVMPMCSDGVRDMFPAHAWNMQDYEDKCFKKYGVHPRPHSALLSYGGEFLESSITNIVFSNGLLDPWSGGGVLRSTNAKIKIVLIPEGAHHIDLRASNAKDPETVVRARATHTQSIREWVDEYRKQKKRF